MKKTILILLFMLPFALFTTTAQKQESALTDSLLSELNKAGEDTNKVNILNKISWENCQKSNYDTALYYVNAARTLAQNIHFKKGLADALKISGLIQHDLGDYTKALHHYADAMHIYEVIGEKKQMANIYNNIGLVYKSQGNNPEALKKHFSALKIYEEIGDKNGIAAGYNNIAMIYASQGNYAEALTNYFAALKINEAADGNKLWLANNYNNIGIVYGKQKNYTEALKNYTASLKMYETLGIKSGMAVAYNNIGAIYGDMGNHAEALKQFFAALEIRELIGDKKGMASNYNNIGQTYTLIHRAKEGKLWLLKSLRTSLDIGAKSNILVSYEGLSIADSTLGNFKGAFENYKQYVVYKDSLYNEENTKKLTQATMQYEFDKKQIADSLQNAQMQTLANERLKKQQTYTTMGVGLAVLLLGFSGLVFRNNKKLAAEKQKSESLLHNILPEEISAELKERGATTAKEFDAVTVLFTDFVNFTQTAERLKPQQLVQELHECFTAFDLIMERYGLEKIKTVGDAYLAVCGLPIADPQHAQKVVKAALEIRDFVAERGKASSSERSGETFEIRIGIHSGPVVAGIVGVKKFAYDIWGDTVNTAARMEQSGEAGKINISESTHALVKDDFECVYRGAVEAKNKGKMNMYFVS